MEALVSIKIGEVTLNHLMWWDDEFKYVGRTVVADRTIAGNIVTQTYDKLGGRPITLMGDANHGWQSRVTVELLQEMASQGLDTFKVQFLAEPTPDLPNPPIPVIIKEYTCRFRTEEEPSVEFSPVTPVDNPGDSFWYTGTIKLITI